MKFSVALALAAAVTVVSAETNAQRLARGLSPNAPGKRATPVVAARHGHPSGRPGHGHGHGQCNTGPVQCCDAYQYTGQGEPCDDILHNLGHSVAANLLVGLNCSPLLGDGADCQQGPVCCEDNSFSGIINVDCSPTTINL